MEGLFIKLLEHIMSQGLVAAMPVLLCAIVIWVIKYRINPIYDSTAKGGEQDRLLQKTVAHNAEKAKTDHKKIIESIDNSKKEMLVETRELHTKLEEIDKSQLKTELRIEELLRSQKNGRGL